MNADTYKIGTRVYNRGDMANAEHFGAITRLFPSTKYGPEHYEITPDPDAELDPYVVSVTMVCGWDSGNGTTRIVTEAAYQSRREALITSFQQRCRAQA